jgi:hypothetical protein
MMKWFLVIMACSNCTGIDLGIQQGWLAQVQQVAKVEMPALPACQQIRALNPGSECWAKEDDKK